jgi:hypothetical protein
MSTPLLVAPRVQRLPIAAVVASLVIASSARRPRRLGNDTDNGGAGVDSCTADPGDTLVSC